MLRHRETGQEAKSALTHGLVGGVGGVEPGQICILRLCAVVWSFDSKVLASSGDSKEKREDYIKRHKVCVCLCSHKLRNWSVPVLATPV